MNTDLTEYIDINADIKGFDNYIYSINEYR